MSGNKKPQTFKDCEHCQKRFGPLPHLKQRYCSKPCAYAAMKSGPRRIVRKQTTKSRSANSLLNYHVKAGNIIRPSTCEECAAQTRIEGAHYNYDEPLRVRWLCRPCHMRWDKLEPKGGTVILTRWEKFTGKTASLQG